MKSWVEIYKERVNEEYFSHVKSYYGPFIGAVMGGVGNKYLEVGCGAGNISKAINEMDIWSRHILIDDCTDMLDLANRNVRGQNVLSFRGDARTMHSHLLFDTVHSHGLLEHFCDDDIKKIIRNFREFRQVHYVPTAEYVTPSRGDERLMQARWWVDEFKPDSHFVFNDGKDLVLIWEGMR